MSQVNSTYARQARDLYETPEWVTEALLPHVPEYVESIWEPAAGSGKMACALGGHFIVCQTDVHPSPNLHEVLDFLASEVGVTDAIITNPPYVCGPQFVEHALKLMEPRSGFVAMLMRTDWDHAKSRRHLFADCPAFAKKIVLTKRIVWFVEADGKPKASPSENHAWFIWDWQHEGPATLAYAP